SPASAWALVYRRDGLFAGRPGAGCPRDECCPSGGGTPDRFLGGDDGEGTPPAFDTSLPPRVFPGWQVPRRGWRYHHGERGRRGPLFLGGGYQPPTPRHGFTE